MYEVWHIVALLLTECHWNDVLVNYSMLAEKLNMAPEEAERWIVNLIRNARLDAKIDSKLVSMHSFITEIHSYK